MSGTSGRILDKQNYSQETLNVFSFIGAYFIDLFYNHLYDQGIRLHRQKQVNTVTDGYKCSLDAFLKSINKGDPELYRDLVHGIHQTFLDYGFTGLSYQNCIDKIVKAFIPQDYWQIISFDDKSRILGTIITNSVKIMIHKIVSIFLADVIDNHQDQENAARWQDEFIDILILERERLFQEFINVKTDVPTNTGLLETMKKEIKLLYDEKKKLQLEILDLKKNLLNAKKIIVEKHKIIKQLEDRYKKALESTTPKPTEYSAPQPNIKPDSDTESVESVKDEASEYTNNKMKEFFMNEDDLYMLDQ